MPSIQSQVPRGLVISPPFLASPVALTLHGRDSLYVLCDKDPCRLSTSWARNRAQTFKGSPVLLKPQSHTHSLWDLQSSRPAPSPLWLIGGLHALVSCGSRVEGKGGLEQRFTHRHMSTPTPSEPQQAVTVTTRGVGAEKGEL